MAKKVNKKDLEFQAYCEQLVRELGMKRMINYGGEEINVAIQELGYITRVTDCGNIAIYKNNGEVHMWLATIMFYSDSQPNYNYSLTNYYTSDFYYNTKEEIIGDLENALDC